MNHLFKLKKDGKTVGYLKFAERAKGILFSPLLDGIWVPYDKGNPAMVFDIAHLFVCKDKNGKDVFADDEVDSIGNRCLVMWHKVHLQWCLWHIEGDYYFGQIRKTDIELIEEDKK